METRRNDKTPRTKNLQKNILEHNLDKNVVTDGSINLNSKNVKLVDREMSNISTKTDSDSLITLLPSMDNFNNDMSNDKILSEYDTNTDIRTQSDTLNNSFEIDKMQENFEGIISSISDEKERNSDNKSFYNNNKGIIQPENSKKYTEIDLKKAKLEPNYKYSTEEDVTRTAISQNMNKLQSLVDPILSNNNLLDTSSNTNFSRKTISTKGISDNSRKKDTIKQKNEHIMSLQQEKNIERNKFNIQSKFNNNKNSWKKQLDQRNAIGDLKKNNIVLNNHNDTQLTKKSEQDLRRSIILSGASSYNKVSLKNTNETIIKPLSVPKSFDFPAFKNKMEAFNEIFESELIYFTDLVAWGNDAKGLIMANDKLPFKKRVKLAEIIFCGVDEIIDTHSKILETMIDVNQSIWPRKLKDRYIPFDLHKITDMNFSEKIGDLPSIEIFNELSYTKCFLKHIYKLDCYFKYVTALPRSEYELLLEHRTNSHFKKTLDIFFEQSKKKNLGIKHFLYRPLQKISRYDMLFDAIYKIERDEIEKHDLALLKQRFKSINKKINNIFGEMLEFFETFKLTKEIQYADNVERLYGLSLFHKPQKILKQGFFDVILNQNDKVEGKIQPKMRYIIILTNLILICDFQEVNNTKTKTIITTPHHLSKTIAMYKNVEIDYFEEYVKNNKGSLFYLYLLEKQREDIVILCFKSRAARDLMKKTINDASLEFNKNVRKEIDFSYVVLEDPILDCNIIGCSKRFIKCDNEDDSEYDDNLLKYDWGCVDLEDDLDYEDSTEEITNDVYKLKKCCIRTKDRVCIHNTSNLNKEKEAFENDTEGQLKSQTQLLTNNSPQKYIQKLKMHLPKDYGENIASIHVLNYKNHLKIQNSIKKYIQDNKNMQNKDNNILFIDRYISTSIKHKITKFSCSNGIIIKNTYKHDIDTIEYLKPSFNARYIQDPHQLKKKHLFSQPKNINNSVSFLNNKDDSLILVKPDKMFKGTEYINKLYETDNRSTSSDKVGLVSNTSFSNLSKYILDALFLNYGFIGRDQMFLLVVPKIEKQKVNSNIYTFNKTTSLLFQGFIKKYVYDDRLNILLMLYEKSIHYSFLEVDGPLNYKKIGTSVTDFFYDKNSSIIAVVEETFEDSTCIVIYKISLFKDNEAIHEKNMDFINKPDKQRIYEVESDLGLYKLHKINIFNHENIEIQFKIQNRLYIGSEIKHLYFQSHFIVVLCQDLEIINLKTLKTMEIIDSMDFIIPYYSKHLSTINPIRLIQVSPKKFFIVYKEIGFFTDNFGRNISNHRVFNWIYIINDAKLFKKNHIQSILGIKSEHSWICCLSDVGIEIWNIETGDLIFLKSAKNLKFVENLEAPFFFDRMGLMSYKKNK